MFDRGMLREGMTVHSADGEKLGKIQSCGEDSFIIEKGFFLPTDYVCRYADVTSVDGDDVRLAITKDQFRRRELGNDDDATSERAGTWGTGSAQEGWRGEGERERAAAGEEIRVPIAEEELEAVKRDREAGEVRLKKDVVTEHRRIDVPVTKEQVRVERTPASGRAEAGSEAFERQTVSMPVREEEVEIRKRPVVKEEVRLKKERTVEQRAADADLRREEVRVEGDVEGKRERDLREPGRTRKDPDDDLA